jgi:hypothetical protein
MLFGNFEIYTVVAMKNEILKVTLTLEDSVAKIVDILCPYSSSVGSEKMESVDGR